MASKEQIQVWKNQIEKYKSVYAGLYPGSRPSDKLISIFCGIEGIPWPLPETEDEFDFLD